MTRYVGVDLHRRRSVIVVLDADGTELWTKRIDNDPLTLGLEIEKVGPAPEMVLEATWGWCWAAGVITEAGGRVHLAHPLGIKGFENRRVKTDRVDARLLADLLRMGRLPEAWIAPESIRHQRELVRYRRKLSQLRAGLKAQVHAVLGKEGLLAPINHLWGPGGSVWLDETEMAEAYETRVRSLRRLIKLYDTEITKLDARIAEVFKGDEGYETIQQLNGVGPVFAAVFCAELGDVTRFRSAKAVCSWAGLTPRDIGSPTPRCIEGRSPNKDQGWSAGPRSKHIQKPRRRPHQESLPAGR